MPAKSQLTDEVLKKIKELAKEGYNCNEISKKTGFKRQTINYWKKRHKINMQSYGPREGYLKYLKFIEILDKAYSKNEKIKLNETLRKIELHPGTAQQILKKYPEYRSVIRSKKDAIEQDKTLNFKEAQKRLPSNENSKIIEFKNGKYRIQTQDGYIYEKTSAKLFQGDPRGKSGNQHTVDSISHKLEQIGYKYLDGFSGNVKKSIRAVHERCQKIRVTRLESFFRQECPTCSNKGVSKVELELLEWVQQWHPEAHSTRQVIGPKELDIYIPSLNLAIEYCGLYWHNEDSPEPRGRTYHYDKMKTCEEKGVRLITVFSDEWQDRREQVTGFLMSVLGKSERRVYARKCEIREVDKTITRKFLDDYHIQGKTTSKIAFGLYHKDELLGLTTGNIHHRQKGDDAPFVLNRLVFKKGVSVVGGASKLLKHLMDYAKNEGFKELISWSDNRWSQGNVYKKTGFTLVEELKPDYSYVTPELIRESKQSNKKKLLLKKGAVGTMANTETELAKTIGYSRIWDCGKKRWSICLN